MQDVQVVGLIFQLDLQEDVLLGHFYYVIDVSDSVALIVSPLLQESVRKHTVSFKLKTEQLIEDLLEG